MTRRRVYADDGRVSIYFAILTPAFIALLGLVVVGGNRVIALQRAHNIAAEAGRAAGQAINGPQGIVGSTKVVDPDAAAAAARAYIAAAGATGTVTVASDRQHLTVTVHVTYDPGLPFGVGAGAWTATGAATITLVVV
jgi:Flp pilus assembly protein TadG